jgi:polysaccharide biosynthesis protein PslH
MRILQLINRVPWPLKDGGSIMYYQYIKGYHDAGCEVTVAALNTTKHFVATLPEALTSIARFQTVAIDNRVKPIPAFFNLFSKKSYNAQRFVSREYEQLLKDLLTQHTYDVIVCETVFMASYLPVLRKHSKALVVLRQHNVEHNIWHTLASGESNFIKKKYLQLLADRLQQFEQQHLPVFDVLAAVTENDKHVFEQMGFSKPIHVAPMGINLVQRKTEVNPQTFFHIGSMEWEPNKEAILWFVKEVWPTIIQQFPKARLLLAGRKMDTRFELPFTQGVEVVGEVDDATLFMSQHQIMVVPLLSGSGIRVKILEGMAAGKAIISTTLGAQGINCEHRKNILIADTADEFCQYAAQLLNNPLLCDTLGNEAQKLIDTHYSNTKVIADLLHFYQTQINLRQTNV